jgi:hypothetical protein
MTQKTTTTSKKYINKRIKTPTSKDYTDLLRFCIQSMDGENPDFEYCVGLLSYAIQKGGLTDKQVIFADKIIGKQYKRYNIGGKK